MARVAFLGVGLMGEPMANRLLRAGHSLNVVAHCNRDPIERLIGAGAVEATNPAAAASDTNVAIIMLPTAREVKEVLFGQSGLAGGMPPGYTIIDMGTSFPPDTRRIAMRIGEIGGRFIDAPVTGRPEGARNGTLTIMVGGDTNTLERVRPLLEAMGKQIYHFGGVGSGHTAKLVQNLISTISNAAIAEGFTLAAAAKLDVEKLFKMLSSLPTASPALLEVVPKVFAGDFNKVNARLDIVYKDIRQATALAREMTVHLPVANGTTELFQLARALGFGNLDSTAVIRGLETILDIEVRGVNA